VISTAGELRKSSVPTLKVKPHGDHPPGEVAANRTANLQAN
jgi:hypothetical protein